MLEHCIIVTILYHLVSIVHYTTGINKHIYCMYVEIVLLYCIYMYVE